MKTLAIITFSVLLVAVGIIADRLFTPTDTLREWMPVKITDADLDKISKMYRKGDTYTRFATESGIWGVTAVRQASGIWIVPCQETGPRAKEMRE